MLIFGTNRFKLKEFTHQELNIPEEEIDTEGIPEKFIVFQSYFHIWFIPFIPDGKVYAFQANGVLYKMPEGIKEHINMDYPVKTPWYSYSGLLLVVSLFLWLITSILFAVLV